MLEKIGTNLVIMLPLIIGPICGAVFYDRKRTQERIFLILVSILTAFPALLLYAKTPLQWCTLGVVDIASFVFGYNIIKNTTIRGVTIVLFYIVVTWLIDIALITR